MKIISSLDNYTGFLGLTLLLKCSYFDRLFKTSITMSRFTNIFYLWYGICSRIIKNKSEGELHVYKQKSVYFRDLLSVLLSGYLILYIFRLRRWKRSCLHCFHDHKIWTFLHTLALFWFYHGEWHLLQIISSQTYFITINEFTYTFRMELNYA